MKINKPKFWDKKINFFALILLPLGLIVKLNTLHNQIQTTDDPKEQNKLISQQNKILSYISGLGISFSSNNKQLQTLLKRVNRGK